MLAGGNRLASLLSMTLVLIGLTSINNLSIASHASTSISTQSTTSGLGTQLPLPLRQGQIIEICNNRIDDDRDGIIDEGNCISIGTNLAGETCLDGVDNDNDGEIDEPECTQSTTIFVEFCGNEVDDDRDGKIDEPGCTIVEICDNGIDDDRDNRTDEQLCITIRDVSLAEEAPTDEICLNGVDDDNDNETDEPECRPSGTNFEFCDNDVDDDGDGEVDEADCIIVEICQNKIDDDFDGKTDEQRCIEISVTIVSETEEPISLAEAAPATPRTEASIDLAEGRIVEDESPAFEECRAERQ